MTDKLREAAQMALEALDSKHDMTKAEWRVLQYHAFTALREALAQPEREWQGLTPEEAREISLANRPYVIDMVYALEAKLKEKNT